MGINAADWPGRILAIAARLLPNERRDWGAAMLAELAQIHHPSTLWLFACSCMRVALCPPRKGELMWSRVKNITTNPGAAALIGFLLATPISLMALIAWFEIEPLQSFLKSLTTEPDGSRNSLQGKIIMLG